MDDLATVWCEWAEMELRHKYIRKISSAQDILGAPATYMIAYTTEKFKADNPKTYKAFVDALQEAQELIKKQPVEMARRDAGVVLLETG